MTTARAYVFTFLAAMFAASGCSMQSGTTPSPDAQEDVDPPPQPTSCTADTQCSAPDGCSRGVCERGVCSAETICAADETCDSYVNACVPNTPPPPPSGNGSIVCSELTELSRTRIVISNVALSRLIGAQGIAPNSDWRIGFGTGSVGTETRPWSSETATYTVEVTNTAALFNFSLHSPGGVPEYWFDLNQFNVSGTCSHAMNATAITHVVPGGGTTDPGNGTISCVDVLGGQFVDVTVSSVAAHLKKADGSGQDADGTVFPTSSYWLRWGSHQAGWGIVNPYDSAKDQEQWGDYAIVLRLPGNTVTFNGALYNPSTNAVYWFDLDEFNVSGSCNHPQGEGGITHTTNAPPPVTNVGTIRCRLWPDGNNVVRREIAITPNSNGIIAGTVSEGSLVSTPEHIKLDVSQQQQVWVTNTSTYYFYSDTGLDDFNFIVIDNNDGNDSIPGGDYLNLDAWTITNESTVHGSSSCQRVGGGISIDNSPS